MKQALKERRIPVRFFAEQVTGGCRALAWVGQHRKQAGPLSLATTVRECCASPLCWSVPPAQNMLTQHPSRPLGATKQDFLNGYWAGRWLHLPYTYNAQKRIKYHHPSLWRLEDIQIIHFGALCFLPCRLGLESGLCTSLACAPPSSAPKATTKPPLGCPRCWVAAGGAMVSYCLPGGPLPVFLCFPLASLIVQWMRSPGATATARRTRPTGRNATGGE